MIVWSSDFGACDVVAEPLGADLALPPAGGLEKSFDGLSALAKHSLRENPLSGAVFVFVNRRRTQMRCLYFDGDGYCLWSKRLERGRFQVRWSSKDKVSLDMSTLRLLVEGIEPQSVHRYKRYRPRQPSEARLSL